jgi:hypothetical protein
MCFTLILKIKHSQNTTVLLVLSIIGVALLSFWDIVNYNRCQHSTSCALVGELL